MLDSLVRVSRRDDKERQINVLTVSFVDRLVDYAAESHRH